MVWAATWNSLRGQGERRVVGRHPHVSSISAALRTLVCVGAVAALMLAPTPADARKPLPLGALAAVTYPNGHGSAGYGAVDVCPACTFFLENWASPAPYELADSGDGRLLSARIDGSTLRLDSYDPATYRRVATRSATFRDWQIGDVLFAADRNVYVLLGRGNWDQSKTNVVIQVRKLDRNLITDGVAGIKGGFDDIGIYQPFEATDSSMALVGGTIVVHTARLIFHIPGDSAPHHQVNLSFAVDTATMTTREVIAPYASHSFRQFVRPHGLDAVFLDHGDAYPRALQVGVVGGLFGPAPTPITPAAPECADPGGCETDQPVPRFDIFRAFAFPGKVGDNYTGTTVNGFEVGTTDALAVGLSVPNGHAVAGVHGSSSQFVRNAYVISTDLTNGTSRFAWITTYRPTAKRSSVGQPQLVPVGANRFAALFTTQVGARRTLRYVLLDETGTIVARKSWPRRQFAALGQPAIVGTKLLWVGFWSGTRRQSYRTGDFLYGLDLRDPGDPSLLTRSVRRGSRT